jgi:CRP-like cAMP-binding protein
VRGARAVRGTDLDPDPTPPPPRSELDSTLVPGRSRPSAIRPVDLSLAGDPDSTLFIANPFAAAGPRAPSARAPEPPAAEVAGPEFGSFPHIPLFETLPPAAFLELVRESTLAVLVAGQVIVEQDALGDSFFVICGGRVRVYREEPTGRRELAILEAGAFFGELAVLTGARRSAWVVAEVDDTRLLEITGETLDRVSRHHPSVAEGLLAFARRRILSNVMASEPLFSALKRSERQAWAERFVPRELQAGELLLAPGQSPPGLVVVVAGQLLASGPPGPDLEVRPGALLGDVELLSGSVEVRVEARAPSSVLVLPPGDAAALLEHPANTARRAALLEAGRRRSAG